MVEKDEQTKNEKIKDCSILIAKKEMSLDCNLPLAVEQFIKLHLVLNSEIPKDMENFFNFYLKLLEVQEGSEEVKLLLKYCTEL